MSSRYSEPSVTHFMIDQVYSMALLCMGVAWPPYTCASQGGVLDIHLLWLPDHLSYIYYDDEYHQWMLLLVIV